MSDGTITFKIERFPWDAHKAIKVEAARQGITIREYTIRALGSHEAMLDALKIAEVKTRSARFKDEESWRLMRAAVRESIAKAKGESA